MLYFFSALLVAVGAMVFAIQNSFEVAVNIFLWEFSGSMALVLLVTFLLGVVSSLLVMLPSVFRKARQGSKQRKEIKELQEQLESQEHIPVTQTKDDLESQKDQSTEDKDDSDE